MKHRELPVSAVGRALKLLTMSLALTAAAVPPSSFGALPAGPRHNGFDDPLDHPAKRIDKLTSRPTLGAARAGERLVAVGLRGLIIYSDDRGQSWQQSTVPVQSDLVAVHFPTPQDGWAVGHDGVVLHSSDGGKSWEKQLDGRLAKLMFERHYRSRLSAGDKVARAGLDAVQKNYATGPNLPYLDVWFKDASTGYVVGSFGTLITTADGGRTWQPGFERLDNPDMLNLNAVRGIGGDLLIAAERGTVFKLDDNTGKFRTIKTGYGGSLFGVIGSAQTLLVYGLRGTVYRSADAGESWQAVTMPTQVTMSGGTFDSSAGAFVLVNVAGEVVIGNAAATTFTLRRGRPGMRYSAVTEVPNKGLFVTSMEGVQPLLPLAP
jgi:photosystem II stability/assembly factor-like uncharacterized protein